MLALALVVGWGLGWVFLALATWLRKAERMQTISFIAMFPLMFASSAFAPVESMPGWLRAVATVNPMTYGVDASRDLAFGVAPGSGVWVAVLLSLLLVAVSAPIAVRGIRRP